MYVAMLTLDAQFSRTYNALLAANPRANDAGTTAAAVVLTETHLVLANVGDSRVRMLAQQTTTTITTNNNNNNNNNNLKKTACVASYSAAMGQTLCPALIFAPSSAATCLTMLIFVRCGRFWGAGTSLPLHFSSSLSLFPRHMSPHPLTGCLPADGVPGVCDHRPQAHHGCREGSNQEGRRDGAFQASKWCVGMRALTALACFFPSPCVVFPLFFLIYSAVTRAPTRATSVHSNRCFLCRSIHRPTGVPVIE